jgi:hypothetical protein
LPSRFLLPSSLLISGIRVFPLSTRSHIKRIESILARMTYEVSVFWVWWCLWTYRCYFYGDISPKSDPNMYVQSIVELYHQFCKQYQNNGYQDIPLVINTHGWLKGTPLLGHRCSFLHVWGAHSCFLVWLTPRTLPSVPSFSLYKTVHSAVPKIAK